MSSATLGKRVSVIVRGYGGKPGKLTVAGIRGTVVDAYGSDEKVTTGFYADHVFKFDEGVFRKLIEAFDGGKTRELEQLWREAEPFDIG